MGPRWVETGSSCLDKSIVGLWHAGQPTGVGVAWLAVESAVTNLEIFKFWYFFASEIQLSHLLAWLQLELELAPSAIVRNGSA